MDRLTLCILSLVFTGTLAFAEPLHLGSVRRLTVEQTGRSEHTDDAAVRACADFKPSTKQIRRFLSQAVEVESRIYTHEFYSPCYATGTAEFSDGTKVQWKIHSGRTGIVKTEDRGAFMLYCKTCRWEDPFAGNYGDA